MSSNDIVKTETKDTSSSEQQQQTTKADKPQDDEADKTAKPEPSTTPSVTKDKGEAKETTKEDPTRSSSKKDRESLSKRSRSRHGNGRSRHRSRSRDRYRSSRSRRRSRSRDHRRSSIERRRNRSHGRSRRSRSRHRSRRRSNSRRRRSRSISRRRKRSRSNSRRRKRSRSEKKHKKKKKKRSRSESNDSDGGADSEDGLTEEQKVHKHELEKLTRDARTVFVSQLQVKVTEKDLKKFFQAVCNVKDVVLICDRFTNRSKGFGYVEVKTLEDVPKALMLTGQRFIFRNGKQGFPIVVKASEAEKNFTHQLEKRVANMSSAPTGAQLSAGVAPPKPRNVSKRERETPNDDEWDDRLVVSNVHPNIEQTQLNELCASFGVIKHLELVHDREGKRKGSANIHFEQSIDAMKALKELNGLELAGLKLEVTKLRKTPSERARDRQRARQGDGDRYSKENMDSRSWRLEDDDVDVGRIGGGGVSMNSHTRASLMSKLGGGLGEDMLQKSAPNVEQPVEKKQVGPGRILGVASRFLCIKNMFDPRTETKAGWEQDIADDTKMECQNFGTVLHCAVDKNSSGHVYVMFDTIQAGVDASHVLHGRWFAKRLIQVEYIKKQVYANKYPTLHIP